MHPPIATAPKCRCMKTSKTHIKANINPNTKTHIKTPPAAI